MLASIKTQICPTVATKWDALDFAANRLGEALIQPARRNIVVKSGHRDAALRLSTCSRFEKRQPDTASSRAWNHCHQLDEKGVRFGSAHKRAAESHGMRLDLRHEYELLGDLRNVVLDRLNEHGLAVRLHPSHPSAVPLARSRLSDEDLRPS